MATYNPKRKTATSGTTEDIQFPISSINGLQTALNGKMTISNTNGGNYLNTKTYIAHHPENGNGSIIPFLYNDLGHLLSKGGSCEIYTTSSTDFTAASLTKVKTVTASGNLFDGTPSYQMSFNNIFSDGTGSTTNTVDTMVIDITCHKAFAYGTTFYIDFGSTSWLAPNIKLLVMRSGTVKTDVTSTDTVYTQKASITNNSLPCYYTTAVGGYTCKGTDGGTHQGFNKLRIVLEKPRRLLRIAQIALINYGSSGVSETYLSRAGGTLYGGLTPYSNKGGNLGSSTKQWNAVYGGTVYENGTSLSSKYAPKSHNHTTSEITDFPTLATVATSGSYEDLSDKPTIPAAITVDSALSSTSTNPVQNKVVKGALDAKLPTSGGTLTGNLIITNSSSTQQTEPALKWKTVGANTPYIGFATNQSDGTFLLGSLTGTNYQAGLAIGGGSGNLLWKGVRVVTASELGAAASKGVDTSVKSDSSNLVTSGAVYTAIASAITTALSTEV